MANEVRETANAWLRQNTRTKAAAKALWMAEDKAARARFAVSKGHCESCAEEQAALERAQTAYNAEKQRDDELWKSHEEACR
jgi:hypothetical protein